MGPNTCIADKFEFWSSADCACEYCVHFKKGKPCPFDVCCIADIKAEVLLREVAAENRLAAASGPVANTSHLLLAMHPGVMIIAVD